MGLFDIFKKKDNTVEKRMKPLRNEYMKNLQDNSGDAPVATVFDRDKVTYNDEYNRNVNKIKNAKNYKFMETNMKFKKYDSKIIDLQHKLQNGEIKPEELTKTQVLDLIHIYKEQISEIQFKIDELKNGI